MKILTLTGIDENTSTDWINSAFVRSRQSVEFAILRSPKQQTSPRYPSEKAIDNICRSVNPNALAFHLCGGYARMAIEGEWETLCKQINFDKVTRVQVNTTKDDADTIVMLQGFAAHIGLPVIFQWRRDKFPYIHGLSLLQDKSGGRGIEETNWISPDQVHWRTVVKQHGYAGGLSPENISGHMPAIIKASKGPFWVDCESSIRTDDIFDTAKAEEMISEVTGALILSALT